MRRRNVGAAARKATTPIQEGRNPVLIYEAHAYPGHPGSLQEVPRLGLVGRLDRSAPFRLRRSSIQPRTRQYCTTTVAGIIGTSDKTEPAHRRAWQAVFVPLTKKAQKRPTS